MTPTFIAIDLGGKSNGNTAACYNVENKIHFLNFAGVKNAYDFLIKSIVDKKIKIVFIDAPLTLPGVYKDLKGYSNFHKRSCDVELQAMSPMFLGGFTANAIELYHQLTTKKIKVIEVYPKALVNHLNIEGYSKKLKLKELNAIVYQVMNHLPDFKLADIPVSLHEVDALLAWLSGYRFQKKIHQEYGKKEEGIIVV
jgi:uncharacterized protein